MKIFISIMLFVAFSSQCLAQKLPLVGSLPKITVYDLTGKRSQLDVLGSGKVTLIACWFIPCPPCFSEMRVLHELYAEYKANTRLNFMTICRTDSAIVKKFIRKDKALANFQGMYESFSGLKSFNLPVYFIPGCNEKVYTGVQLKNYKPDNIKQCPDAIFKFQGYPTLMIFDKRGAMIFSKTAYNAADYAAYKKQLKEILDKALISL